MNIVERAMKRLTARRLRKEAAELFTWNCNNGWPDGFSEFERVMALEAEARAIEEELRHANGK